MSGAGSRWKKLINVYSFKKISSSIIQNFTPKYFAKIEVVLTKQNHPFQRSKLYFFVKDNIVPQQNPAEW